MLHGHQRAVNDLVCSVIGMQCIIYYIRIAQGNCLKQPAPSNTQNGEGMYALHDAESENGMHDLKHCCRQSKQKTIPT